MKLDHTGQITVIKHSVIMKILLIKFQIIVWHLTWFIYYLSFLIFKWQKPKIWNMFD